MQASIQKVINILPIEGADNIELAHVLGWQCVVKKGEFNIGDLGVYIEIDSILPEASWSSFLAPRKYKVKTIKMRGELSQGLMLPLDVIQEHLSFKNLTQDLSSNWKDNYVEGDDVTELLDVVHYEKPEPGYNGGEKRVTRPNYFQKTDEPRIQSFKSLNRTQGEYVYLSVKCDGTSATFSKRDDEYHVCSRNNNIEESPNIYWDMYNKYNIVNVLDKLGNFAIQGEICGPGIQKNRMGLKEKDLFVFSIFDIDNQEYISYTNFVAICSENGLKTVPILGVEKFDYSLEDLIDKSNNMRYDNGSFAEGIVIRSIDRISRQQKSKKSMKIVSNNFLLKNKE